MSEWWWSKRGKQQDDNFDLKIFGIKRNYMKIKTSGDETYWFKDLNNKEKENIAYIKLQFAFFKYVCFV